MKVKEITGWFIILIFLLIVGYDVYAYIAGGQEATISSLISQEWIYQYPAFTFAMGFVMGHLFWPMSKHKRVVE